MKPVFLIAHQRSGTNALRSILQQSKYVEDCGEAFNPNGTKYASNIFHFLRLDDNYKYLSPNNNITRFLQFYEYLRILSDKRICIIDAKYDSLRVFDPEVHELNAPPVIFSFFDKIGSGVIHLTRNPFDLYVSYRFAVEAGIWHWREGQDRTSAPKQISLDATDMIEFIAKRQAEQKAVNTLMNQCGNAMAIDYSELFPSDGTPNLERVSLFLGIPQFDYTIPVEKSIQAPLADLISNYSEIVDVLNTHEIGYLAR